MAAPPVGKERVLGLTSVVCAAAGVALWTAAILLKLAAEGAVIGGPYRQLVEAAALGVFYWSPPVLSALSLGTGAWAIHRSRARQEDGLALAGTFAGAIGLCLVSPYVTLVWLVDPWVMSR
ncbi:MAG: hypothetical protein ACK47B_28385 [Armatimonadota bacterium]